MDNKTKYCGKCKQHGLANTYRNHTNQCPFVLCQCGKCVRVERYRKRIRETVRRLKARRRAANRAAGAGRCVSAARPSPSPACADEAAPRTPRRGPALLDAAARLNRMLGVVEALLHQFRRAAAQGPPHTYYNMLPRPSAPLSSMPTYTTGFALPPLPKAYSEPLPECDLDGCHLPHLSLDNETALNMSVEVRSRLLDSLKSHRVTCAAPDSQVGLDFYKYFFTNFPALRSYFKGAQNYEASDVQKSERFEKQGRRLILAMHFLAANADQPEVLRAFAREQVIRHRPFKMEHALWRAFFDVWLGYLGSRGSVDEQTRADWLHVGVIFADEAVRYSKEIGV